MTEILKRHDAIESAAVFGGGTAPRFFLTVSPKEQASYLAQVLVVTRHDDDVPPLIVKLRAELDREIVGARCVVKQLEQGPPVEVPIQIRLIGDNLDVLRAKADEIAGPCVRPAVTKSTTISAGACPWSRLTLTRNAPTRSASGICKLEYAGEAKELKQSKEEIGRVMLISLALITLAMVIQFNSVTKSLVVMLTVPLGLIGAFTGLAVMHTSLGFMAFIGIMSLAGAVVSHIIVLSDFIEEARAQGMELKEALVQAGLVRLRAVLVTVLATVGGLIPLNLTGGELWRPLTAVHIFGLLFATSLTLVALPVLYYIFCTKLRWIK